MVVRFLYIALWLVFLSSCTSIEQKNKKQIIGTWLKLNEKYKDGVPPPPESRPVGVKFYENGDYEFLSGFFKVTIDTIKWKSTHKYLGTFSNYKLQGDSLEIYNPIKESSSKYRIFFVGTDTLCYEKSDSVTSVFVRMHENINKQDFDRIILSRTGCYGSCPIFDISIDKLGNVIYYGEGYVDSIGFYKGNLDEEEVNLIFDKASNVNIDSLENSYSVGHTDDESVILTFIKDNKIIKTIHDYGMAGPPFLVWSYTPISFIYHNANLKSIKYDSPYYENLNYYSFYKDSLIISLEKSESFYLWTELNRAKKINTKEVNEFNLWFRCNYTYWGRMPNSLSHDEKILSIDTDGRYYKFNFESNNSDVFDLEYDFLKRNFSDKEFRKPKPWE